MLSSKINFESSKSTYSTYSMSSTSDERLVNQTDDNINKMTDSDDTKSLEKTNINEIMDKLKHQIEFNDILEHKENPLIKLPDLEQKSKSLNVSLSSSSSSAYYRYEFRTHESKAFIVEN